MKYISIFFVRSRILGSSPSKTFIFGLVFSVEVSFMVSSNLIQNEGKLYDWQVSKGGEHQRPGMFHVQGLMQPIGGDGKKQTAQNGHDQCNIAHHRVACWERPRQERSWDAKQCVDKNLPRTSLGPSCSEGKHEVSCFLIIVVGQPCDGPKMGELPHELNSKKGSRFNSKITRCSNVSDHRGECSGNGSHKHAHGCFGFEWRVNKCIGHQCCNTEPTT